MEDNEVTWLAEEIFSAFPQEFFSLKFYTLDCGCIYYQRGLRDGDFEAQVGIYRDAEHGPCEVCMLQEENWKDKVISLAVGSGV